VPKTSGAVLCPGEAALCAVDLLDMTTAIDTPLPRTSEPEAERAHRALFSDASVVKESAGRDPRTSREVAQAPLFSNPE
jgi:hypothetical protein